MRSIDLICPMQDETTEKIQVETDNQDNAMIQELTTKLTEIVETQGATTERVLETITGVVNSLKETKKEEPAE